MRNSAQCLMPNYAQRLIFYILILSPSVLFAQLGGKHSFEFLNVPNNARLAALGGVNASLSDRDVNFFYSNPALVGDTLSQWASLNYQFYLADIGHAAFSYAHQFNKIGSMAFGVQHMGYGTLKGYDASGVEMGNFKSGETAFVVSKSHQVNNFRMGVNLKVVSSSIAGYHASAVMVDLGGAFIHPKKQLTVGLVMKNLGFLLSDYTETNKGKLPFDLQVGSTFKPEHMPFRFSLTAYNLTKTKAAYYNPLDGTGEPGTLDKVLRRFNFATEVLIHRNVNVLLSYNYRVHQELKLSTGGGGAGISFGFSARIKALELIISRSGFVGGSAGYSFTLSANTQKILKRG